MILSLEVALLCNIETSLFQLSRLFTYPDRVDTITEGPLYKTIVVGGLKLLTCAHDVNHGLQELTKYGGGGGGGGSTCSQP